MKAPACSVPLVVLAAACLAQQSTINLDGYRDAKKYALAEASYTVGKHTYTVMNIKPLIASDTSCIGVIVIDKRKLVLHDIGVKDVPTGLVVPARQPIRNAVVVLKPSPLEGKTFLLLPNAKLVTLPGANLVVDTAGSCAYVVWNNDGTYRLTVFDYQRLRMIIEPTVIAKPTAWFTDGMSFWFTAEGEKGYYCVDVLMKSVTRLDKADGKLKPMPYLGDPAKLDARKCCGKEVLVK
jgi:hypothetical protein